MYSHAKKTLIAFVALAMLMPGVYLAFRPAPAQAQWFNTTILDLGQVVNWIVEIGVSIVEGMAYKTLKNLAKSLAHKMVETTMTEFATGEKGQEPFWSTKAWDKEMKDLGSNALGFGLEGMAIGFERGHENSKMSGMNKKADSLSSGSEDDKAKAGNLRKEADQMKANQKKRDEAYRRGKSGGVSDEVASVVGWLCNPSMNPNISLKIALGIGNLGEDPDAKPLCDVNQMAQNWGALYDQFRTFDPSSINGWQMLGNLFDTDSSEVGVAFNANNVFFDVHEKKVVNDQIEAFVKALTGKDKTDEAGKILTPGDTVREWSKNNIMKGSQDSSDPTEKMTGRLVADAADIVGTFVDSLLSKGSEYLQKGLVRNIKEWQSASKDKEFDKLAGVLDKNAQIRAAEDAAAAAQARVREAESATRTAQTRSTLAVAEARELAQSAAADPGNTTLAAQAAAAQTEATAAQTEATQAQDQATAAQAQAVEAQRTVVAITTPSLVAVNPAETAVLDAVYNPDAAPSHGGIAAVRQYASKLTRVESMGGGILDVLAQLRSTECTFSANACVLGDAFANAVQQKMTVKEAMEAFRRGENAGMNPDGIFGFENQLQPRTFKETVQPTFQTNFPYNSLVVLRKYRVIPVSWELAALYIKDHPDTCEQKSCTLQDMLNAFDEPSSPFFRMVDPNWVLKLPAVYCALKGYGPIQEKTKDIEQTVCKNDINGDGKVCCDVSCLTSEEEKTHCAVPSSTSSPACLSHLDDEEQTVTRMEACLDEQTCLDDDAQGTCKSKMYGYCLEEKKLWRFKGTECNTIYASCDTFTDKDTKTVGFYLKDSIPPSNCTAETAGCQWYSTTRFTRDARTTGTPGDYVVKDWNSAEKVYFTPKAQICSDKAEGCRGLVDVSLANMDTVQAPRAVLIGQPTWSNPPLPSWSWLKDNNYFSVADIDLSSTAEQLAAKNYDIYFVDSSYWSVGTAGGDAIRKKLYALWHDYGKNVITVGNDTYGGDIYPVTGHIENGGYAASPDADHLITRKHRTATDIGSHSDSGTAITQARQGFTILYRKTGEQNKILGIIGESQRGGIWFHDQNGALTSNQNGKEILANAVKYMTAISEAKAYVRVAPDYLGCNEIDKPAGAPDTWKPSYRREECKPFALHCSQNYVGCELYTPKEAGGFPIAATGPQAGCKEACAGLTQYSIQKTRIESQLGIAKVASSAAFIPTSPTIQQCAVADVGCDEFTNILTGAEAEQRAYFKEIRRCEKKPEHPENVTVFYSPAGSNFGGYSLDKFFVKADLDGAPACFPQESCTCTEEEYYTQFINPAITTINCRQMYVSRKSTGFFEPEYYQMDKLIYYTDDCKDYRRTLSGANGTIYKISPSMSQTCPAASAACREFRDPTAGNVVMTDYSNFEDNTSQGWSAFSGATALSAKASNESESIGNHSLEVKNTTTGAVTFEKNGLLLLGDMSYLGGLSIKVPAASKVSMEFLGFENADGQQVKIASASSSIPADTWRYLTFAVQRISDVRPTVQGNSGVRIIITPVSGSDELTYVLLDAITLKQATGVIYAVDDSWTLPDECLADPSDKTTADVTQIGCKLYTDRGGAQAVFRDVAWLCPNEMVGCKNYTRNETNIYLVKDTAKKCLPADNGCTAYGMPTLDIAGNVSKRALSRGAVSEQWTARYLKVTPEDARAGGVDDSRGICWSGTNGSGAIGCRAYHVSGQLDKYFKDPGRLTCQWRMPRQDEIDTIKRRTDLSPQGKLDAISDLKVAGVWYYKTCKKKTEGAIEDTGVKCTIDKDCQTIGDSTDVCTEAETQCEQNMLKSCPSNQKTCRKIMDPECKTDGTLRSDYGRNTLGISCQREYYYLADTENKGECEGRVDVDGGCLLFDDANAGELKYASSQYYTNYSGELRGISLNAATGGGAANDANKLLKVRLDRTCKTWLECANYVSETSSDRTSERTICTDRLPCNKRAPDGTCATFIYKNTDSTAHPEKDAVLAKVSFSTLATLADPIPYASLTGIARPDFTFRYTEAGLQRQWSTTSAASVLGHDSLFGWEQKAKGNPPPDNSKQLYLSVASSVDVVNSCRIPPRSDSPEVRYTPDTAKKKEARKYFVNTCDYQNKQGDRYQGIDGYCIEPYPKFMDIYTATRGAGASYGFRGACLNWYPSDRIETAASIGGIDLFTAAGAVPASATQVAQDIAKRDVYLCVEFGVNEHEETVKNSDGTKNISVSIPKVDPIRATGRKVLQCVNGAGTPYSDGRECVADAASFPDTSGLTAKAYRQHTNLILTKFSLKHDGESIPNETFEGTEVTKESIDTAKEEYRDAKLKDFREYKNALHVRTCDAPSGETGNSSILKSTDFTDIVEGRCADGTKKYKQLPRIDKMRFLNKDGSPDRAAQPSFGYIFMRPDFTAGGSIDQQGYVLVRAPDDNNRDTIMDTKRAYTFQTVRPYRPFVAGGGSECKTPSDTDISDWVWPGECQSGTLTDLGAQGRHWEFSGYCDFPDYTETNTEKIKILRVSNGNSASQTLLGSHHKRNKEEWMDGGTGTDNNGADYDYGGDWVDVRPDWSSSGGNRTFKGWNISTLGFDQVNVHGTIAKRYRPACSDDNVDQTMLSRIDKVTFADGTWDCFGGQNYLNGQWKNDEWEGKVCMFWSSNRQENQTGDTPVYDKDGQKGIVHVSHCPAEYGWCDNGTRAVQWQERKDFVDVRRKSYDSGTQTATWSDPPESWPFINTGGETKPSARPNQQNGLFIRVTQNYSAAQRREDKVVYYGKDDKGDKKIEIIQRNGTTETDVPAVGNPTKQGVPQSEIDAGEATTAGVPIHIPRRDKRPEKLAYTITAKATYRDVYCKRVVKVASGGAFVPFYTQLGGAWRNAWLTQAQVTQMASGPIILRRTVKDQRWHGTEPVITTLPGSDTTVWSANSAVETARHGYSPYDKAAHYTVVDAAKGYYKYDWQNTLPCSSPCLWPSDLDKSRPDREDAAIRAATLATSDSVLKSIDFTKVPPRVTDPANFKWHIEGYNSGSAQFQPKVFNDLAMYVIAPSTVATVDFPSLPLTAVTSPYAGKTGDSANINITSFNYTTPPIPFAKYYEQLISDGIDNAYASVANRPHAFVKDTSKPGGWFPGTQPEASPPVIYDASGTAGSFSYVKSTARGANKFESMSFFVDVADDHLPLRKLSIVWGDGTSNAIANYDEGKGIDDSFTDKKIDGTALTISEKIAANKRLFKNVGHAFVNSKFDTNEVCIEAMDNWCQITRLCSTLQNPGFSATTSTNSRLDCVNVTN